MGAFYNSICIPGDERQRAEDSLLRWLGGRGFELSDQQVLFDLDAENERCAFVVWNRRWTLLFFSNYEEERRLIRELQTWSQQLLYVWVQDSDVWGYDVFDPAGFAGSFNSDPRTYVSFADDPGVSSRPTAEPWEVCGRFDLDGRADELAAIHRRRAVFGEDVCEDFCRLIDAAPALTSYDDLERGAFGPSENWQVERLMFVHRDAKAAGERPIDLHRLELGGQRGESAGERTSQIEIPPEVLAEIGRRRGRIRRTTLLLRPLSGLARAWRRAIEAPARWRRRRRDANRDLAAGADPSETGRSRPDSGQDAPRTANAAPAARGSTPSRGTWSRSTSSVIEVRHLINERHCCRIRLAVGGETKARLSKPAAVFAFQIGPTAVTCTARRRSRIEEVLQQPAGSQLLRDEKYRIGDLEARHVLYQLPPFYLAGTPGPSFLGLHVVQTDWALYVFLYRFPERILKEVDRSIRATVASFRIVDDEAGS